MAKNKKVEEVTMDFPELPIPQEPSVEEQIKIANQELENRCLDLTLAVYRKEEEISKLKREMEAQNLIYQKAIAKLVVDFFGKE